VLSIFERTSIAISSFSALLSLVGLLFVGIQVRRAAKQAKEAANAQQEEWIRRRKQATIEFLTNTMTLSNELKTALPYLDRTPSAATRLIARADKDEAIAKAIRSYLDYLENVATGVNEGVLDVGVVDRANGGRIIDMATNYASYIQHRRGMLNDPQLYIELEQLAAEIRNRRGSSSGLPVRK
jgi:hypothetical protein